MNINHNKQQGTILIVALFIVVLLEIVVVGFVLHHKMSIYNSRNFVDLIEAQNYLLGGEEQAKAAIVNKLKSEKPFIAYTLPKTPIPDGFIEGFVIDAQSQYNINNVFKSNIEEDISMYLGQFNNLLQTLLRGKHQEEATQLISYLRQRALKAKQDSRRGVFFFSITELRSIPGITQQAYTALKPYISALPYGTLLNVNTASDYALLTLDPKLTLKETKAIVRIRETLDDGFISTESFYATGPIQALEESTVEVTVKSDYYLSSMTVQFREIQLTMNSLLKVTMDNDKPQINVLWRSFGTL